MCSCKRSAEGRAGARRPRRGGVRGLSLVELIVAQTIVAIIAAGMFALIGGMTRSYHDEHGAAEAQIRLREASSVLLRSLQGIGGAEGRAGHLVMWQDGGADAADSLTIFRADYGVCAGVQSVLERTGTELVLEQSDLDGDTYPDCPLDNLVGCGADAVVDRVALVEGAERSAQLLLTEADAGGCALRFQTGVVQSLQVESYNRHFDESAGGPDEVLDQLGEIKAVRFGSSLRFEIDPYSESLTRSIDAQPPTRVLDGVYDLQVVTGHDLPPGDGMVGDGEWSWGGNLSGATPENFFGVRVGLITYGGSRAGVGRRPPAVFGNRLHDEAPADRRYRSSFVFAAARNR